MSTRPEPTRDAEPKGSRHDEARHRISDRLSGLVVIEGISLAIALVAPVTPSKTGSRWSPAEIFTAEPNYLQQVLASFVTVNLMFVCFGIAVWFTARWGSSE